MGRESSLSQTLRQVGIQDPARAGAWIESGSLSAMADHLSLLKMCADPDEALIGILRLCESSDLARDMVAAGGNGAQRLISVLGASRALGDYLLSHLDAISIMSEAGKAQTFTDPSYDHEAEIMAQNEWIQKQRELIFAHLQVQPNAGGYLVAGPDATSDALRRAYRQSLLRIAADDLTHKYPSEFVSVVGRRLAGLVDATLEAALALARRDLDPQGLVSVCVMAMGKTGAQELNYISDVDVIYVVGPGVGGQINSDSEAVPTDVNCVNADERVLVELGTRLVAGLSAACCGAGSEPPLWPLDASLRPEGKDGALVRTVPSHLAYYQRWAKSWEFQALLKARPCAGDLRLGHSYLNSISPLIWSAVERDGFVQAARDMRQRIEAHIPRQLRDRQLKLGPGGLRDVEFTVQLLQLVHGRTDETLRVPNTLEALAALAAGGYIGREAATQMSKCYRFLRVLEHRAQLFRMQRTHLMPSGSQELRRLGRSLGADSTSDPSRLEACWLATRQQVRQLHEEIFYRPLLPAMADLAKDQAQLSPQAAQERLASIGYTDPRGSFRHIEALSAGVSRRAAIQRQLLPVMIGWFADGTNPDTGLLRFRSLSERIGRSHWYLGLLRDSKVAAERLCQLLGASTWVSQAFENIPDAVRWLDDDNELVMRSQSQLTREVEAICSRYSLPSEAITRIRQVRYRELTRVAIADILANIDSTKSASQIAVINDVILQAALDLAVRTQWEHDQQRHMSLGIIALGRQGGFEPGYASDADVMFVHQVITDEESALAQAKETITRLRTLLAGSDSAPPLLIDIDLRPEGRSGQVSRTLESYREYYQKWSSPWERQALLRARPLAGQSDLLTQFFDMVNPIRYGQPPTPTQLREIRRIKARMESERLPRGTEPTRHVKLGPGGLSDVEWTVQVLQLQYSSTHPQLQVTPTLSALDALLAAGIIDTRDAQALSQSWLAASRIRAANTLVTGRCSGLQLDILPRSEAQLLPVARIMGYRPGREHDLEEDYRRYARRARAVMEKLFYA